MKTRISLLFFALLVLCPSWMKAQEVFAVNDTICVELGQPIDFNVKANDDVSPGFDGAVFLTSPTNCFELLPDGRLFYAINDPNCCGDHSLKYQYEPCQGDVGCTASIFIKIKCPKPDCFVVNLEDFTNSGNPDGGPPQECVAACENSTATYFVNYNPMNTYNWSVVGGIFTAGSNPAEIMITWGAAGTGAISLTVTNTSNQSQTYEVCVDILEAPVADFVPSTTSICRDGSVFFMNNSISGNDYFWDFGDGATSTQFEPTHQFTTAGTFTVTLYVTRDNFDDLGNPLCCCTDSTSVDITVDPLNGPEIYCISTLCAFDSTKYWTNALNCGTYDWTVLDAVGTPISFTGQGNDTICVQWGDGPIGIVQLEVADCDNAYCDEPSTEIVPIISSTAPIDGLTDVCEFETEIYTLPKWLGVIYNWQVSGGTVVSGQGTHAVVIQWGPAPGPGVITVTYSSDFLGGLPDQDPLNCEGRASLNVSIKPEFELFGPSNPTACVFSSSSFFTTASPSSSYTWTVTPFAPFIGQGTNNIVVSWDTGPGTFTVTAIPDNPAVYCNDVQSFVVNVTEVVLPLGIDGPIDICPGETYYYFAQTTETGVGFTWNAIGGTPTIFNGNPIAVTWDATGPYILTLQQFQLNAPYCTSNPIQILPGSKEINGPLTITGPNGCINSIQSYTGGPVQHPDATYEWSVVPPEAGSIIAGQGTANVQVQWNNDPVTASLNFNVAICGDTLMTSQSVPLNAPQLPTITQTGVLCPGVSASLDAGAGFSTYNWSTGSTSQTTTISASGTYSVTTTDGNGCEAVASYQAQAFSGPVADISTPDFTTICIIPPNANTVTLYAQTNPNYSYSWTCLRDGVLQPNANTSPVFVHTNDSTVATFTYYVVVTDQNGCTSTSNTITVRQTDDCDGPPGCEPMPYQLIANAFPQNPNCDEVDFIPFTSPNVTVTGWNFGDPANNTNTGTLTNASHKFSKAGYFIVTLLGTVPEQAPGTGDCVIADSLSVCIPLAADFDFVDSCQTVFFNDLSTYLPGQNITSWFWDFGDGNFSSIQHPSHTYATAPGSYVVSLTVMNLDGCQATITQTINVDGAPTPGINANPNPVCVGEPVSFNGSGAGIITWLWNFDDGATNGSQNPSHAFLNPGNYDVSLTVTNPDGCSAIATQTIVVHPAPSADTIAYSPALTVCDEEVVTLSGPAGPGYTYLWTNGATTPSITVTTSGEYALVVIDQNGCTLTLDPVLVTVIPKPEAIISGDLFICDGGCILLKATIGQGYAYQWFDGGGNPIPGAIGSNLQVCDFNLNPPYTVEVSDLNGCSEISDPVVVSVAASPSFAVTVAPDGCEGTLNTLTVNPVEPDVVYSWSNGANGPVTTAIQQGIYTVIGTDTLTGCSNSATATINPLPDLCLVPVGCYEVCNPDTICGPAGLAAYQWNFNGMPIAGETGSCLIVNQAGVYSLTATTDFGCSQTSDDLMLEVRDCDTLVCEKLRLRLSPLDATIDDCCWTMDYQNNYGGDLAGLTIYGSDADFNFDLGSLDPVLAVQSIGDDHISLVNSTLGSPIPSGNLTHFLEFCLTNIQNVPQQIFIDWYDFNNEVVCSDTLSLDCADEPECLYVASDSIYCEGNQIQYELEVCNPLSNAFNVGYIKLLPSSPAGVVVSPSNVIIPATPIVPGDCQKFILTLSGPSIANQDFCFTLVAHDFDPDETPLALCCSLEKTYCVSIPDCDPCDDIGVEGVSGDENSCCYDIYLYNNFGPGVFDGIDLCMLSPNTTMTINNPFGSGWQTAAYTPTVISLDVAPPFGGTLPLGVFQLPNICLQTQEAPSQILEIKWMQGDSVVCRDTISLNCEPDCGYILEEEIECNGQWTYSGLIKNTSAFVMDEANIIFNSPGGLGGFNQTITFGSGLLPGSTYPFSLPIGLPAIAGDTVCFTVALHEENDDDEHTNCCNFTHCIVLPECLPPFAPEVRPNLYPNPSWGGITVDFPMPVNEQVRAKLLDVHHNEVGAWTKSAPGLSATLNFDLTNYPKGMYLLTLETTTKRWVMKVVLQ